MKLFFSLYFWKNVRGQSLLEQMVQLVNFGAALDAVKAQIQSFFEELVTVLPSQAPFHHAFTRFISFYSVL